MAGYKRIHYDYRNNNINLWYFDEDGEHKITTKPEIDYFIEDKTNQSSTINIFNKPVIRKVAENSYKLKETLKLTKRATSEANIPMETKFLHSFFKDKVLAPDMSKIQFAFIDIEVEVQIDFPKAEEALYPINLITIWLSKTKQTYTFGNRPYTGNKIKNYRYIPDEVNLIETFIKFFRKAKVDILSDWNGNTFDVPYIINRCKRRGIELSMSPVNEYKTKKIASKQIQKEVYEICGIAHLDYIDLYIKYEREKRASYKLDYIGMYELNEGKDHIEGPMHLFYKQNWDRFVEYNVQDVNLLVKLEEKKHYIELAVTLAYGAMIPFDSVYSTTTLLTGYTKKFMNKKNMVFPDAAGKKAKEAFPGGYVMAKPIFLRNVMSFDFESLYPHIMMQFGISPEKLVQLLAGEIPDPSWIKTPASDIYIGETKDGEQYRIGGIYYKDDKGIIPEITKSIFDERKDLKNKAKIADGFESGLDIKEICKIHGFDEKYVIQKKTEIDELGRDSGFYKNEEYIRKILVNSLFGSIASSGFGGMYDVRNAAMITIIGQTVIKYVSNMIEDYTKKCWHLKAPKIFGREAKPITNKNVSLIDTDSVDYNTNLSLKSGDILIGDFYKKYNPTDEDGIVDISDKKELSLSVDSKKYSNKTTYDNDWLQYKKITYIKKHTVKKRMFKIVTGNKSVKVTEDHSVIVERDSALVSIKPKEIQKTDQIVVYFDIGTSCSIKDYKVIDLDIQEQAVYDIEVEDNHNFFGNGILVHNSNYIHIDPYIKSLGYNELTDQELIEFGDKLANEFFKPFFKRALDEFAKKYNCTNKLNFKQEKTISHFLVQSKKHYAMRVVASEGKVYKQAKIATTGLEDVKSSTPIYCKEKLSSLIEFILLNQDKKKVIDYIRPIRDEFNTMKTNPVNIASPRGVNNLHKWIGHIDLDRCVREDILPPVPSACPIAVRAALMHNYMIKKYNLSLEPIGEGNKIKFIYINNVNVLRSDVIGFKDTWPKEFDKFFKVDHELQFNKTLIEPVQRFFDVLGWGQVTFADNDFDSLF